MVYFLSSSPCERGALALNPANGFVRELKKVVKENCSALLVCSDPDNYAFTDEIAAGLRACFGAAGFEFSAFRTLDRRNEARAAALVRGADLVILAGGHVPTQNRFFQQIGLRGIMDGYEGVVVGISAGTMNSAEVVYAQPELEGEAVDEDYERFLPGLGITRTMILPHYHQTKDALVDGLRPFEDIACGDSFGRRFYALADGSYLLGKDGAETIFGEAYLIADGAMEKLQDEGGRLRL